MAGASNTCVISAPTEPKHLAGEPCIHPVFAPDIEKAKGRSFVYTGEYRRITISDWFVSYPGEHIIFAEVALPSFITGERWIVKPVESEDSNEKECA